MNEGDETGVNSTKLGIIARIYRFFVLNDLVPNGSLKQKIVIGKVVKKSKFSSSVISESKTNKRVRCRLPLMSKFYEGDNILITSLCDSNNDTLYERMFNLEEYEVQDVVDKFKKTGDYNLFLLRRNNVHAITTAIPILGFFFMIIYILLLMFHQGKSEIYGRVVNSMVPFSLLSLVPFYIIFTIFGEYAFYYSSIGAFVISLAYHYCYRRKKILELIDIFTKERIVSCDEITASISKFETNTNNHENSHIEEVTVTEEIAGCNDGGNTSNVGVECEDKLENIVEEIRSIPVITLTGIAVAIGEYNLFEKVANEASGKLTIEMQNRINNDSEDIQRYRRVFAKISTTQESRCEVGTAIKYPACELIPLELVNELTNQKPKGFNVYDVAVKILLYYSYMVNINEDSKEVLDINYLLKRLEVCTVLAEVK